MKKTITILIFFISFFLASCEQNTDTISLGISLGKVTLNEAEKGFEVTLTSESSSYLDQDILRLGVIYGLKEVGVELTKENALGYSEATRDDKNSYTFIFSSIEDIHYSKSMLIRPYIVYGDEESMLLGVASTFSMFGIAKLDASIFGKRIIAFVDGKLISTLSVTVNTKTYQATTTETGYKLDLYTDYNIIRLTITLDKPYLFSESVDLVVNHETIPLNRWSLTDSTIIYTFDDPNWTMPY